MYAGLSAELIGPHWRTGWTRETPDVRIETRARTQTRKRARTHAHAEAPVLWETPAMTAFGLPAGLSSGFWRLRRDMVPEMRARHLGCMIG